jgi:hypothetical protein
VTPAVVVHWASEEIAQFYAQLHDLCDDAREVYAARFDGVHQLLLECMKLVTPRKLSSETVAYVARMKSVAPSLVARKAAVCEKVYKRIFWELTANGGPWAQTVIEQHWKLWKICDAQFHRVFMKPNSKLGLQKDASFSRDEACAVVAKEKFEGWLTAHASVESLQSFKEGTSLKEIDSEFSTEARLVTIDRQYVGTFFLNNREICFNDNDASKSIQFFLTDLEYIFHDRAHISTKV